MLKKMIRESFYNLINSFKHQKPFWELLYFYYIGFSGGARRKNIIDKVKALSKNELTSNQYLLKGDAIVGIWNYTSRPYSLGDTLNFCIELTMETYRKKLKYVDVYIVADPKVPAPVSQQYITGVNYEKFLFEMLPIFNFCPVIRDIHIIRDRQTFELELVAKNLMKEHCYPSLTQYFSELDQPSPYSSRFSLMNEFKKAYGFIPQLKKQSCFSLLSNNVQFGIRPDQIFVAVHLRQRRADNAGSDNEALHRDADLNVWLKFFKRAESECPLVKFVIVGRFYEFPRALFFMSNVIILKSYGYGISEELTVIQDADLFMGSNSGPATVAMFSETPYFIFQDTQSSIVARELGDMEIGQEIPYFAYEKQFFKWCDPDEHILMNCLLSFVATTNSEIVEHDKQN